ncbi:hypothetical protein [Microbacterium sp. BR1]|uniref:hypothetical protein n=1 Tax=Microbacterium sp. BR1 TaxID=1070896 RepID=UPI000C2BF886|nr:hypothetical protein [Microbacterium sp. BR1]
MSDAQQMHTATKQQLVRADAAQRAQRAWALRVAGSTWAQVASAVDYADASTACRAVRQFFGQLPTIEADEQRRLWRDRLERLWNYADRDAKRGRPGAVRAGVAVAQPRHHSTAWTQRRESRWARMPAR